MPLLRVIKPPRAVRGRKAGREEASRERGEREAREGGREEGERSDGWDGAGQQPKGSEGTCTHTCSPMAEMTLATWSQLRATSVARDNDDNYN